MGRQAARALDRQGMGVALPGVGIRADRMLVTARRGPCGFGVVGRCGGSRRMGAGTYGSRAHVFAACRRYRCRMRSARRSLSGGSGRARRSRRCRAIRLRSARATLPAIMLRQMLTVRLVARRELGFLEMVLLEIMRPPT